MPTEYKRGPLVAAVAPSLLREMNRRLLLDRLFLDGPATRPELARKVGLSQPTVFAALDDLRAAGLVRGTDRPAAPNGRPAAVYEANPAAGHVVGVDIGRSWLHAVVSDLGGTFLAEVDARNTSRTAAALVELVNQLVMQAVEKANLGSGSITHTVIGSPGVLDPARGRVLYAANLPGWHRTGLVDAFTELFGASLTIDNDVNLAALAEHAYGAAQNARDFAYLKIGTGVGLGLVLDGHVYRGSTGAAGEVGYLPIGDELSRPSPGHPMRGMLEEALAADAVVKYARAAGMTGRLTAEDVFSAARHGDNNALAAIHEEAKRLAQLIASISAFLDPELIVLGGGVGQNLELMRNSMYEALALITPMKPRLAVSTTGSAAVVRGAIARGITIAREIVFNSQIETTAGVGG